jgi:RNA polymerase sigma factor (sigma-70 family)
MDDAPDPKALAGRPEPSLRDRADPFLQDRSDPFLETRSDPFLEIRSDPFLETRPDPFPCVETRSDTAPGGRPLAGSGVGPAPGFNCDPPAPPDFLGRRLFGGAGPEDLPDGRPPELAFLDLMRCTRAPLRSLFRHLGIGVEDAEDLLQEALLIVTERWKDIQDPRSYLLGTVRNLSLMHRRRLQGERQVRFELGQVEQAGAGEVPQRRIDCQLDARQLLARLPEPSRRIVEMRYGEELSSRDVALALDCSAAGVRQSASRAVRRLRRYAAAHSFAR